MSDESKAQTTPKLFITLLYFGVREGRNTPRVHEWAEIEVIPIHGIEVAFGKDAPKRFRCEPGNRHLQVRREGETTIVQVPPLDIHTLLVGEYR